MAKSRLNLGVFNGVADLQLLEQLPVALHGLSGVEMSVCSAMVEEEPHVVVEAAGLGSSLFGSLVEHLVQRVDERTGEARDTADGLVELRGLNVQAEHGSLALSTHEHSLLWLLDSEALVVEDLLVDEVSKGLGVAFSVVRVPPKSWVWVLGVHSHPRSLATLLQSGLQEY